MIVNFGSIANYNLEGMQVFKIEAVESNEKYQNVSFTLVNSNGAKKFERFNVYDDRGLRAFSGFCRAIVGNVNEIDCESLVGKFVKFECEKYEYEKDGEKKTGYQKKKGAYYESVSDEEKFGEEVAEASDDTEEPPFEVETSEGLDALAQFGI